MRIRKEALDELIEHGGELKHSPINSMGVLRLALDLRDARQDAYRLLSAMAFIKASGHAGSAIMSAPQILAWAEEIGWKP